MNRRWTIVALLGAAVLVGSFVPADAAQATDPPVTTTVHLSLGPVTVIRIAGGGRSEIGLPCVPADALYEETVTGTATLHSTLSADGTTGSVHGVLRSDYQEVPLSDPSLPTYIGRSIESDHEMANQLATTLTMSFPITIIFNGSDGTRLFVHIVIHLTINQITAVRDDGSFDGNVTASYTHGRDTFRC